MGEILDTVQEKIKSNSANALLFVFKLLTGSFIGLTFALIGEVVMRYGDFSFVLVIVVTTMVFLRISRRWRFVGVSVFILISVLVGMLLRLYVMIAPGA